MVLPSGLSIRALIRAANGAIPIPPATQIWRCFDVSKSNRPYGPSTVTKSPFFSAAGKAFDEERHDSVRLPRRCDREGMSPLAFVKSDKGKLPFLMALPSTFESNGQFQDAVALEILDPFDFTNGTAVRSDASCEGHDCRSCSSAIRIAMTGPIAPFQ